MGWPWLRRRSWLDKVFALAVGAKGADGALEITGGWLLWAAPRAELNRWIVMLTQHELMEDPDDYVATHLRIMASHLSLHAKHLAALYLMAHGLIKVILAVSLLRNRLWAYPAAIAFLSAFAAYTFYRFAYTRLPILAALAVLNLILVLLISLEYAQRRKKHALPALY
ncbi:MAG TPA: DUF2127 domain-containing protein [Elusimicrobiota bacterium]|nr:DUF2127 domain-containing protein [Elusimicrobiota bacterium]